MQKKKQSKKAPKKSKEKVIEVKNLCKKYGDVTAVNDISFNVYRNEIFGLLGPNGAGKTTTLEVIETLRDETSGEVLILSKSINQYPSQIKMEIGVQLQEAGFYPNTKVNELISLFEDLYGIEVDHDQLLRSVDLYDKKNELVKNLSGGQKQRFSIATTLINKPKIVFLDEPTTGLDPQARRNLWRLIEDIRKSGTTVVLTTHYMDEAEHLCDRVAIMDQGEIVAIAHPDKLIEELIGRGFKKETVVKDANLEDVFLDLTGHKLRD